MRLVCQLMIFLYTTLPHNLIKEKVIYLTERIQREWSLYLGCNDRNAFFTSEEHKRYTLWSCQSCMKPSPFFWTIFILDLALSYTDKFYDISFCGKGR